MRVKNTTIRKASAKYVIGTESFLQYQEYFMYFTTTKYLDEKRRTSLQLLELLNETLGLIHNSHKEPVDFF
jgi:hypothetical protein